MNVFEISNTKWKSTFEGVVPDVDFYECSICCNGLYLVNGNCEKCGTPLVKAGNKDVAFDEERIEPIFDIIKEHERKLYPLEWTESFLSAYRKSFPNGKHFRYASKILLFPTFYRYYWLKVIETNDTSSEIDLDTIAKENSNIEQLHNRRKKGFHVSDLEDTPINGELKKIWDDLEDKFWKTNQDIDLFEKVFGLCGITNNHWLWVNIFWTVVWTTTTIRANRLLPEHLLLDEEKKHLQFSLQFKESIQNIPFDGPAENQNKKNPFESPDYWQNIRAKLTGHIEDHPFKIISIYQTTPPEQIKKLKERYYGKPLTEKTIRELEIIAPHWTDQEKGQEICGKSREWYTKQRITYLGQKQ